VLNADRTLAELFGSHPKDLSERVHFMGALGDDEFRTGMAICNTVVMPYSRSRPVLIRRDLAGVELGCRVIASRPGTFSNSPNTTRTRSSFSISATTLNWPTHPGPPAI